MIVVWILLGILALISLLAGVALLLPADVLFLLDGQEGFRIRYRFLGKFFGEEAEEAEPKPKAENPIIKSLKRSLGLSHLESVRSIRDAVETHGAGVTIQQTAATLRDLIDRVFWILKRCTIRRFKIASICGGEDAPLDYGTSCAVIYPLVSYLEAAARLRPRAEEIEIYCDDARQESVLEFHIEVRVYVWHILHALLHIIKKNVEKDLSLAEE